MVFNIHNKCKASSSLIFVWPPLTLDAGERAGRPSASAPLLFLISHVIKTNDKDHCSWFGIRKAFISVALMGLHASVTVNVALTVNFCVYKDEIVYLLLYSTDEQSP